MNKNKKNKNAKTNKNIEYIELANSLNTPKSIDNNKNLNSIRKGNGSFS